MKSSLVRVFLLAAALLSGIGLASLQAEDLGAVKARMEKRLPLIDHLKVGGVVGENNQGLAELRGGDAEAGDAVAAENRDRGIVYAEIARQTGTSVAQVGRVRARQIAAASAKGVWLQRENGEWYQK